MSCICDPKEGFSRRSHEEVASAAWAIAYCIGHRNRRNVRLGVRDSSGLSKNRELIRKWY